jgi:signal transduction histidine kinase/CheY-like chemotaxis protein
MPRSAALLVFFLLAISSAGANEGADSRVKPVSAAERSTAWLANGEMVSQTYSLDETGMHGPIRFALPLDDGLLLAGCWSGVYLFDGTHWSPISGIPKARSWLKRSNGSLLIGSGGSIYEVKRGSRGAYECVPVQSPGNIETVFDFMTELSDGRLAVLYGKGVMIEQPDGSMKSFPLGTWTRGLVRIKSGMFLTVNNQDYHLCQLDPVTGAVRDVEDRFREILGPQHIVNLLPRDGDSCWVITLDGHTYVFNGTSLTPAPWQAAGDVDLFVPTSILRQKDGNYIVGSVDYGVFFFSAEGKVLHRLTNANGLPETTVADLCLDADDGLWITTARHLTRIDAQCRYLSFSDKQGLKVQDCEAVTRHRGRIYVAAEEGLFEQNLDARNPSEAFRRIEGLLTSRGLTSDGETLWAGGNRLAGLQPDGTVKFYDTGSIVAIVIPSDNKNRLVCATTDGFAILDRISGEWRITKKISLGGPMPYTLLELKPGEYWASCGTGLIARLRVRDNDFDANLFGLTDGVPNCWIFLVAYKGNLYASVDPHGVRRWDSAAGHFTPSDDLTFYDETTPLVFIGEITDKNGDNWVLKDIRSGVLLKRPSKISTAPLQLAALSEGWIGRALFSDEDGSTWICYVGGVLRCSGTDDPIPLPRRRLVIRDVKDIKTGDTIVGMVRENGVLKLPLEQNALLITAAFLDFRSCHYSKFKIWVDGIEKEPADWSPDADRELTHLPSGSYLLHVQGHDGIGLQSQSIDMRIVIATPWYETRWAIAGYSVIGLLFVGLLIRVREMRLRWHNLELTRAVEEGRREIEVKHRELQGVLGKTEAIARDLATANTALEKSTQGKTEFVRTISHELRNPIAGARMMADLLCRSELDTSNRRQAANLRNCVDYLQTLLDETLDLTQVESGHIAVKLELFTTGELIRDVASIFENIAQQKKLRFDVIPGPKSDVPLLGDKTHSKRILVNYLSNAFKFTAHGSVTLRAEPILAESDLCRVRFEVSDTGPGVSEALQGRLFAEFVRESSHAEDGAMPGAGLGLALSKKLAELCGGSVGFSTKVGEGSRFWVELPFIVSKKGESVQAEEADLRPDFSDLAVFVVDDDPLQLEAMATALEQFGVVPATARNADEALGLLKAKCFGVVILDYHIGQERGLQLLIKAREQDPPLDLAKTQCHLVTALWDESLPEKAAAAGFLGAHKKPLSLIAIFQILQAARRT